MTTQKNSAADEAGIRQVIDAWVSAFRNKDTEAARVLHDPNTVSFDIVPPLRYVGWEAYRKPWDETFALFEGPILFEIRDLNITVRDDIAFSYSLNHMNGTRGGEKVEFWFRWTVCYQKIEGKWRIVHDHSSAPTDFATGNAVLDLVP